MLSPWKSIQHWVPLHPFPWMSSPPSVSLLLLLVSASLLGCPPEVQATSEGCQSDKLVVYKFIFNTYWDSSTFPKQYPEWRPPAQWSKVVGFSHEDDFHLFQMGQESSLGVKEFAETGETETLDKMAEESVLDGFHAPPIETGAGHSHAKVFIDGNHTMVSVISKIVPSPDWFVGLDGLNLCQNGRFIDSVTVEADPMDAGTDNGFTFTSPNWPTVPQAVVFRITNTYPTHPAGSFHYPQLASLPTIASFSFIKEKEYELSEVFHMDRSQDGEEGLLSIKQVNKFAYNSAGYEEDEEDKVLEAYMHDEEMEDEEEEELDPMLVTNEISQSESSHSRVRHHHNSLSSLGSKSFRSERRVAGGYHASSSPSDFLKKKYKSELLNEASEKVFDKESLYKKILESYQASKKQGLSESLAKKLKRRRLRKLRKHSKRHHKPPRDCKVSEWSDWGPCSKSCGIGEAQRRRTIEKHPKRGGKTCPRLESMRWCGSARNCRGKYFDW